MNPATYPSVPLARLGLLLLVALGVVALQPSPAHAATFTVTTVADSGPGSLRDAIVQANADPGADTITFAVSGTITLTTTLPAIPSVLTIQGPGAGLTVSGGDAVELLQVSAGAQLTLDGLTLTRGQGAPGGAIVNSGTLTITNSTLSGNTAIGSTELGGAIFNQGSLTITNSTLSGNTATGTTQGGGAIFTNAGGTTTIISSTIADNQSRSLPVFAVDGGSASLHNVVLANPASPNCGGTITDLGGNIAADASCPVTTTSSHNNTNPLLGPLQNNGGPTQTMALQSGSPAIDAGVNCPPPATDQRGEPRTTPCDSGAYETEATPTGSLSPTSGPEAGGTLVTITGSGFVPGQTSVSFGITPALNVECPSTTLCQAVSPPGMGTVPVVVTVAGQASTPVVVGDFTYLPTAPTPSQPMTLAVQVWRQLPPIVSENQTEITVVPVVGGVVEALVEGVVCGRGETDQRGRVTMTVAADPPVAGCGRPGRALSFRVNGAAAASDPLAFQSGGQTAVTLILPGPMPPPRRF